MKFASLLKKELREMLNTQTIFMLLLMLFMMYGMGGMLNKSAEKASEESSRITICDLDDTKFTQSVLMFLEHPTSDMQNEVKTVTLKSDDYAAELDRLDVNSFVIIPEGFTDDINNGKQAKVTYVSRMTSMSMLSNVNVGSETALQLITSAVKTAMYSDFKNRGKLTDDEAALIEAPVTVDECTIVRDKSENISQLILYSSLYSRSLFMPLVVYILILLGSQTMINAVSAEKLDKTLETLLSAPITRLHVISAKMLAAAAVALLNAVVYMIGMNNMNLSPTGDIGEEYTKMIEKLGLVFDFRTYLLIGVQMLLTMLISLSIAMILGAFAKNIKSSQTLLLPLMFVTIVPFMACMFLDISTLPGAVRYVLYAIPFTHTFMASDTVMFGKTELYTAGLIYQAVFLIICMTIAVKIFTSDYIFTAGEFIGRRKKKKHAEEDQ
ncbi:MAG: ABC transporter permease [Ruminococcus sp.]|nr:ABC transporter permease [Ruminococcus sp.]